MNLGAATLRFLACGRVEHPQRRIPAVTSLNWGCRRAIQLDKIANEAGEALSLGNRETDGTFSDVHVIRKLRVASGEWRAKNRRKSRSFTAIRKHRDWVRDDKAPTP